MTGENADGDDTNGERRSTDEAPGTEPAGGATDDRGGAGDDVRERLSREADRATGGLDASAADPPAGGLDTGAPARGCRRPARRLPAPPWFSSPTPPPAGAPPRGPPSPRPPSRPPL